MTDESRKVPFYGGSRNGTHALVSGRFPDGNLFHGTPDANSECERYRYVAARDCYVFIGLVPFRDAGYTPVHESN